MKNWRVWKMEKNYQLLFFSNLFNGMGNRFTQVALLALIYQYTQSGFALGLLFFVRLIPFLIMAPIGGMLADRFSKRSILLFVETIRVPIVLTLLFAESAEQLWIVYVSSFGLALGEAIYAPTRKATIPALVQQGHLVHINSIEQISMGLVLVIGSSLGGLISFLFGMNSAFLMNALCFLVSIFFLANVQEPNVEISHQTERIPRSSYRMFFKSKLLIIFIIISFTMPIANGVDNVLMSIYALDVFSMADLGVGLIYACLGIGFILSSFSSNFIKKRLVFVIILFIAFEGLGHIFLSLAPSFLTALLTVIFITFTGGISDIGLNTLIMKSVPRHKQGTFFGLTEMITNVTLGIMMAVGGLFLEFADPRLLGAVVGMLYILFTCIYWMMFKKVDFYKEKRRLFSLFN
ncbi:MFS transporter [Allobacillus sp. GCM10007491]|uniref:MFS transporter n=1 Tax=Allobacillus saliphilus TaxID=2912308 RepID=A0A941CUK9_9BACI|nr:MFS transporter [Allobacillus saliphilus]MBR7554233.1 MFS transporter [Allobacillus saliphilus]